MLHTAQPARQTTVSFYLETIGHIPYARGGVFSYVVTIFFYLPMPARNFLISWHITNFAVHGFCGDLVFLCSYPTMCRANFFFHLYAKSF